ncbi:hypothetical protein EX30DRAFT_352497 [Ascodesmis nigricans]|uniref:Uncharacterized protein n=1 Tax=Ascodesmis nigricans TaxID=341454 RepID=A0A4V6RHA5_9PEZI|nr:hypothetical protein EX30DRAFT_352497 [Ascodesmis nigricans]
MGGADGSDRWITAPSLHTRGHHDFLNNRARSNSSPTPASPHSTNLVSLPSSSTSSHPATHSPPLTVPYSCLSSPAPPPAPSSQTSPSSSPPPHTFYPPPLSPSPTSRHPSDP